MKSVIRAFVLLIGAWVGVMAQPQPNAPSQYSFYTPPPGKVDSIGTEIIGNSGLNQFYYWVIANYANGSVLPSRFSFIRSVPSPLTNVNMIKISWGLTGADTYTVVRTINAVPPTGQCNACVVTDSTIANFTYDAGQALGNLNITSIAGGVTGYIQLTNTDGTPRFETSPALGSPSATVNWGDIDGTMSAQTDLNNALNALDAALDAAQLDITALENDVSSLQSGKANTNPTPSVNGGVKAITCDPGEAITEINITGDPNCNAVGGGGGGSVTLPITATKTSSTVITFTCTLGTNCNVAEGDNTTDFATLSTTATMGTGNLTAYVYVEGTVLKLGYNTGTVTCAAGITCVTGVSAFPAGVVKLYVISTVFNANQWGTITDWRAMLVSAKKVVQGTGPVTVVEDAEKFTVNVAPGSSGLTCAQASTVNNSGSSEVTLATIPYPAMVAGEQFRLKFWTTFTPGTPANVTLRVKVNGTNTVNHTFTAPSITSLWVDGNWIMNDATTIRVAALAWNSAGTFVALTGGMSPATVAMGSAGNITIVGIFPSGPGASQSVGPVLSYCYGK